MSKTAFSLNNRTTKPFISLVYCAVAEKGLAVVGHYVTSEYLEVSTDKFFCVPGVSRVADRQERVRVERARAERERQEGVMQEQERLVRERGEERERGAARVDRDGVSRYHGEGGR